MDCDDDGQLRNRLTTQSPWLQPCFSAPCTNHMRLRVSTTRCSGRQSAGHSLVYLPGLSTLSWSGAIGHAELASSPTITMGRLHYYTKVRLRWTTCLGASFDSELRTRLSLTAMKRLTNLQTDHVSANADRPLQSAEWAVCSAQRVAGVAELMTAPLRRSTWPSSFSEHCH